MNSDQAKPKAKRKRSRVGPDGLSHREREFVHAYALTLLKTKGKGNATEAAKMVGCPETSAAQRGHDFMKLPHVQSAIAVLVDERAKKFDISSEAILQELAAMAFANMADFLKFGEDGSAVIDWSKMTREQSAAIQEVTIDEYQERTGQDDDGKPTFETVKRIRFKLHDKRGSLELLGKHQKLFGADAPPPGGDMNITSYHVHFVDPEPAAKPQRKVIEADKQKQLESA